jgi:hypothetical protein
MIKRIVMLALVCVLIISAKTSGKSYSFNVKEPSVVGSVSLKAGDYRLKLDGTQVVLTDKDGKVIDTNAKLETAEHKFDQTAILSRDSDGSHRIVSIQLGGTSYSVVFE